MRFKLSEEFEIGVIFQSLTVPPKVDRFGSKRGQKKRKDNCWTLSINYFAQFEKFVFRNLSSFEHRMSKLTSRSYARAGQNIWIFSSNFWVAGFKLSWFQRFGPRECYCSMHYYMKTAISFRAKAIKERLHFVQINSSFEVAALFRPLFRWWKRAAISKLDLLARYKKSNSWSKIIPSLKLAHFFTTYMVREKERQFQNWNYFWLNGVVHILYML